MRFVILGPPGAGKGTQAAVLSNRLGVPHISTGDLFRAHIGQSTQLGIQAQKYLDAGDLVPSSITVDMVKDRISEPDTSAGYLLDGFPRTIDQAHALEKILAESGTRLDGVLSFAIDENVVIARMLARGRADDDEHVIRHRLRVYQDETAPLLTYYHGLVRTIDALGEVGEVTTRALSAVNR
ncbi:adenylate kinase [Rhodococcus koreensis]